MTIGLSQQLLGSHLGRFNLNSGVNYNRDYIDLSAIISDKIKEKLTKNPIDNVKLIREEMVVELNKKKVLKEDEVLKKILLKLSCTSDIVLDLHCDSNAILHMYTHERLWPTLSDLAAELGG